MFGLEVGADQGGEILFVAAVAKMMKSRGDFVGFEGDVSVRAISRLNFNPTIGIQLAAVRDVSADAIGQGFGLIGGVPNPAII